MNTFNENLSEIIANRSVSVKEEFKFNYNTWPPIEGKYSVLSDDSSSPIIISTLGSVELVEKLKKVKPKGICAVGKTETENIGIEKIIKNTITNSNIRFFILAGRDPKGHRSGQAIVSLMENGIDENMKIIDAVGKKPILNNVTYEEIEAFRKQVKLINLIGCEKVNKITKKINEVYKNFESSYSRRKNSVKEFSVSEVTTSEIVQAQTKESKRIELDKAGYFVIIPTPTNESIIVEHYSYDNELLRIIRGKSPRDIYLTIIENEWVTEMSHAAYLGKELMKAELSMKMDFKYVQDGA